MRITLRWFILVAAIVLAGQQMMAGTVLGVRGTTHFLPTTAQPRMLYVYGDWIENVDRVTTSTSSVTATIKERKNGAQNNTGDFAGRGMVALEIRTNGATPGVTSLRLIDDPTLGVGGDSFDVNITIVPTPAVTSVEIPEPAEPFKEITVVLRGAGLQDAKDPAQGAIVHDNLIPLLAVGGNVTVSSVRVLSSTAASLTAKIFFTQFVQDVTVDLTFLGNNDRAPLSAYFQAGQGAFKNQVRVKSSNLRNYVKAVTFPFGSTFDKNSTATIHINLLYPAPAGAGGGTVGARPPTGLRSSDVTIKADFLQRMVSQALDNSRVWIKLVPANAFEAVPNGTPITPNGYTELRASAGDDIIPLTVKIKDCLGGQPGQTNVVKIQTWMHNQNTNQPPDFVEQNFNVRCTQ